MLFFPYSQRNEKKITKLNDRTYEYFDSSNVDRGKRKTDLLIELGCIWKVQVSSSSHNGNTVYTFTHFDERSITFYLFIFAKIILHCLQLCVRALKWILALSRHTYKHDCQICRTQIMHPNFVIDLLSLNQFMSLILSRSGFVFLLLRIHPMYKYVSVCVYAVCVCLSNSL